MKSKLYILLTLLILLASLFSYNYFNDNETTTNEIDEKTLNPLINDITDPIKLLDRLNKTEWKPEEDSNIKGVHYLNYSMKIDIKSSNSTLLGEVGTYANDVGSEETGYFSLTFVNKNNKGIFKYAAYILLDEMHDGTEYYDFNYYYINEDGEKISQIGLGYYDKNHVFILVDREKMLPEIEKKREQYK